MSPIEKLKQDIEALDLSINKWRMIAFNHAIDNGIDDCALCGVYHWGFPDHIKCRGCPIYNDTGDRFCTNTPYLYWIKYIKYNYVLSDCPYQQVFDYKSEQLALAMFNYLWELRKQLIG